MWELVKICGLLFSIFLTVASDTMIVPGKWSLLKMEKKAGGFDKFEFDLVQRKYNRTHDMFQGTITCYEDLNDFFGAQLDICKYCDGGCKQYQLLSDDSFGNLVGKYAADNFKDMFRLAGMENSDFPLAKCEGTWQVTAVEKCENPLQYPMDIEVSKRKINRTHDGFTSKVKFDEDFTTEFQMRMESYEKVDGGYKASDIMIGETCSFLNRFAQENFQEVLRMAGLEHLDCPVPKGNWVVEDYVIDYSTLPGQGKCGEYKWIVYLIKNNENRGCVQAYSTFTKVEHVDDDE